MEKKGWTGLSLIQRAIIVNKKLKKEMLMANAKLPRISFFYYSFFLIIFPSQLEVIQDGIIFLLHSLYNFIKLSPTNVAASLPTK